MMDVATVNNTMYTSIAGIGFDAFVAQKFAESSIRGVISYMKIILNEFRAYKPVTYKITIDDVCIEKQALMIIFANGNQFGFNARIAPDAKVDDGFLDVCIFKKMPVSQLLKVGYHMMMGTPAKTGYAEFYKGQNITINHDSDPIMNIDGETKTMKSPVNISIKPLSLCVIVP